MKAHFLISLFSLSTVFGYSETNVKEELQQKRETAATQVQQPERQRRLTEAERQQDREAFRQKVQAHKVAYFTDKLSLTPEEAQKFWPIYNAYFSQREQLMNIFIQTTHCCDCRQIDTCIFDISRLTDVEIRKLVDDRAKLIDLDKKFLNDLRAMFSPQRVLIYYNTEREFQRELIDQHSGARRGGSSSGSRESGTTPRGREGQANPPRR